MGAGAAAVATFSRVASTAQRPPWPQPPLHQQHDRMGGEESLPPCPFQQHGLHPSQVPQPIRPPLPQSGLSCCSALSVYSTSSTMWSTPVMPHGDRHYKNCLLPVSLQQSFTVWHKAQEETNKATGTRPAHPAELGLTLYSSSKWHGKARERPIKHEMKCPMLLPMLS